MPHIPAVTTHSSSTQWPAISVELARIEWSPIMAVVGDVHIVHHQHVVADAREHPAALGTAMDGGELADAVVVADFQARGLAVILEILRRGADRSELEMVRDDRRGLFEFNTSVYGYDIPLLQLWDFGDPHTPRLVKEVKRPGAKSTTLRAEGMLIGRSEASVQRGTH